MTPTEMTDSMSFYLVGAVVAGGREQDSLSSA